jgi:hypothetical protein
MMLCRSHFLVALAGALATANPALAQESPPPGVTEVAPGVRHIDGKQVPATVISFAVLKAAIGKDHSFNAVRHLFTVGGIPAPGPAGTTTMMYKVRDPDSGKDAVAILFLRGDRIVEYMVE